MSIELGSELMFIWTFATPIVAGLVTALTCPRLLTLLRAKNIVDTAVERSSHTGQVPRGGGIAIYIGMASALTITSELWVGLHGLVVAVAGSTLFGLIGLIDDLQGLPATSRLFLQSACALGVAFTLITLDSASDLFFLLLAPLSIVAFVNAFNFMDGINGISATTTVIVGSSMTLASIRWDAGIEIPTLAIVGATAGFAPFNAINRLFLGDIGSYLLGSALAILGIIGVQREIPVVAIALPFCLYLADVSYTLWRRAARRQRLMEAHREHVYQRLANEAGLGHAKVTGIVGLATLALAGAGQIGGNSSSLTTLISGCTAICLVIAYLSAPKWAAKSR